MIDLLTIIYAPEESLLLPYRDKATHWLPEVSGEADNIYCLPNTICTTRIGTIDMVKILIMEGFLPSNKVIWINAIEPQRLIAYTFSPSGEINNFFGV